MRLALLSDIHGNPIALDAVLADIAAQGEVDAYLVLGDVVAIGYDPIGVIERLVVLPNVVFVRGNTDRYTTSGERPPPTLEDAQSEPELLPVLVEVAESFAWTQGCVTATGWLQWLTNLPLEARLTLPDGTNLLGVHASPGYDDERGIHPKLSDDELRTMVAGCDADLVCVGHTHFPLDRSVGGVRVVNVGSVSNPITSDLRASYVLLDATPASYTLQFRKVAYDVAAVIAAILQSRHPSRDYLSRFMHGQVRSWWSQA
jgi:predicted phosphodiesterase